MENKDFKYWQDWDKYDGMFDYKNDKTISTYNHLREEFSKADLKKYDMFVAFTNEQFEKGLMSIRPLKDGEKIVSLGGGIYGTRDGIKKYSSRMDDMLKAIAEQCDPQEVYVYEFNNHESAIDYDGDLNAIKIIIDIFGVDIARNVKRTCEYYSIDTIIK